MAQSEQKAKYLECLIDTGYDGFLAISPQLAEELRLIAIKKIRIITAGNRQSTNILSECEVSLSSDVSQTSLNIPVLIIDEPTPIIGASLLQKFAEVNNSQVVIDYNNKNLKFECL